MLEAQAAATASASSMSKPMSVRIHLELITFEQPAVLSRLSIVHRRDCAFDIQLSRAGSATDSV